MKMIDLVCNKCGHVKIDHLVRDVDPQPPYICPECGQQAFVRQLTQSNCGGVIPDGIPGGIWIKNGICNDDGTPKRYDSRSEMKKAADAKGLVNRVRHQGTRGGDKSKWTSKWY
jgi:hypothetical protein